MRGSCHLDRASNVEIGVEYQNILVAMFFLCCCEMYSRAPSGYRKDFNKNIAEQFILLFDPAKNKK